MFMLRKPRKVQKNAGTHKPIFCGVTDDGIGLVLIALAASVEMFQVIMGTMLLVTVPMNCTSTNAPFTTTICTPTNNVFTPGDFIADESGKRLAKAAIVINFFMLAIVVLHYLVIFHRERIMLDLLDSDPTVANDRLAEVLPYYTQLAPVIKWAHSRAFFSSILFFVFFLINTIISGIVIFKYHFNDFPTQTITVFVTNNLLLLRVLYRSLSQSLWGLRDTLSTSLFTYPAQVYNVIDLAYVDPRDVKLTNGGRIDEDGEDGKPIDKNFNLLPLAPLPGQVQNSAAGMSSQPQEV